MRGKYLLSSGALGALILPAVALAQSAASADDTPTQIEREADSNTIIVTAQRRNEALENVPMAVTVIGPDALSRAGGTGVRDLDKLTAGLQVGAAGAFTAPSIRGVSTLVINTNIENNVALYVDGFYEPNTITINADLPDIESVQVLKGPQGTLYGRNATGGAILVNTRGPADELTATVEAGYARFDDKRINGFVAGPITEGIGFSLAGYYRESDGYVKLQDPNDASDTAGDAAPRKQALIRAKLAFDLSSSVKATLGYTYTDADDPRGLIFSTFQHESPALPPPPGTVLNRKRGAYDYRTSAPAESHQGTLKLEVDTGIGELTSYTGYGRRETGTYFDADGSYADFTHGEALYLQDTYQQAVDLVIDKFDNLDLVVGGLYYEDKIRTDSRGLNSYGPGGVLAVTGDVEGKSKSWALYVDGTLEVTDRLSLNLGGRYTEEKKTATAKLTLGNGFVFFPETTKSETFSKFTPRASLIYEVGYRTNIYASFSKGFRSGQYNQFGAETPGSWEAIDPETISAYEVGFKTSNSRLQFDVAAFYYDYKNLQVQQLKRSITCPPEPAACGTLFQVFQNAPTAEIYGADAQISYSPIENLTIRGGLSLLHAEYTDFEDAAATGLDPVQDVNVTQVQDWSGLEMARAPDFSGNVGLDYRIPNGDGGLLFSTNLSFTDDYVVSNPSLFGPLTGARADKQRYVQDGYALLSASVTWTHPSGRYWISAYGTNLTDKKYAYAYTGNSFGDYGVYAEPLVYGIKLGAKY